MAEKNYQSNEQKNKQTNYTGSNQTNKETASNSKMKNSQKTVSYTHLALMPVQADPGRMCS